MIMKAKLSIVTLGLLFVWLGASAQSGLDGINYQAVARNTDGTVLAEKDIRVRLSVIIGPGWPAYSPKTATGSPSQTNTSRVLNASDW